MESWDTTTHQTKVAILRDSALFGRLGDSELSHLAFESELIWAPGGTVLTRQGEHGTHFYFLVRGAVRMTWNNAQEPRTLERMPGGTLLGWSALVEPYTYTADTTAGERCQLLKVGVPGVMEILRARADVGFDVMQGIAAIARARFGAAIGESSDPQTAAS